MSKTCTNCAAALADSARFCANCGHAVAPTCDSCGSDVGADDKFCATCGAATGTQLAEAAPAPPVAMSDEAPSAETRKIITVLFADLVGFTAHTEQSDPEDVRARLTVYHTRFREDIERHGGRVEKLLGDGVFAVFGAPNAHEDDPERAVRSALRAQQSVDDLNEQRPDLALSVRIAVTTGEAIVQLDHSNVDREGIVGDVVNTASRLQGEADPGAVVVDERTYTATKAVIEYGELDPVTVKGKVDPIPIWRATGARARLGVALEDKMTTSFTGRAHELSILVDAFDRTVTETRSQVVTISGEPGVGKSRLVAEFRRVLDDRPDLVLWRQGRCLPYGEGITFFALAEIVRSQAGILGAERSEEARAKLRLAVANVFPNEDEHDWIVRALEALVGADDAIEADPQESAAGWRQFLGAMATQSPLVVIIEDLHWGDAALVSFLNELTRWGFDLPIFLVCTSRPELYSEHPEWGSSKRNAIDIGLSPLGEDDMARLVEELLGVGTVAPDRLHELVERCGGNPLYAIEYAALVKERGADLTPPDSVQALIAARLDLLDHETRTFLQAASVVGRVFWAQALRFITSSDAPAAGEAIHELRNRELIWPVRSSSMEGQEEYLFRHVLVRDVTYGQIPRSDRARLHEQTARWIEAISAQNLGETTTLLAHHYSTAHDLRIRLGESRPDLAAQALRFTLAAAEQVQNLDSAAAIQLFTKAAALTDDPLTRGKILVDLAEIQSIAGDREAGIDVAREATELFAGIGESALQARALAANARAAWLGGDGATSEALNDAAYALVADLEPSREVAAVLRTEATRRFLRGQIAEAAAAAGPALEMTRLYGTRGELALALRSAADVLASVDEPQARALMGEALQVAMEGGLTQAEISIRNNYHGFLMAVDGPLGSLDMIEPAIKLGRQRGFEPGTEFSRTSRLECLLPLGRWDEAILEADEVIAWDEARGATAIGTMAEHFKILVELYRGRAPEALQLADAGLDRALANKDPQVVVPALAAAIAAAAEAGDLVRAAGLIEQFAGTASDEDGVAHARSLFTFADAMVKVGAVDALSKIVAGMSGTNMIVTASRSVGNGLLALVKGEYDAAVTALGTGRERLGTMDYMLEEAHCRIWEAQAHHGRGDRTAAEAALAAAREFFEPIGGEYFLKRIVGVEAGLRELPND